MKNKISFSGIWTLCLSECKTFSQHIPLATTLYVWTVIGPPHVHLMMFGHPIRVETHFRPKMFGPDQAEAQNFAKICSDQHPGSSLIIGGPALGGRSVRSSINTPDCPGVIRSRDARTKYLFCAGVWVEVLGVGGTMVLLGVDVVMFAFALWLKLGGNWPLYHLQANNNCQLYGSCVSSLCIGDFCSLLWIEQPELCWKNFHQ